MKRILSALAAAASIAGLALGAAGTAQAAPPPPKPLIITEVATGTFNTPLRDFIEIVPSGGPVSFTYDVAVLATFAGQTHPLGVIPAGTILTPGMVYTVANIGSGVACAQQFFNVNLPANIPIEVRLVPAPLPLAPVDAGFILQTFPLSVGESYHRTWVTPSTFAPGPETPCVPPVVGPEL
ncbi:hypothetical protein LWC34_04740 [Kibdelosporangium philippinense]|uniref:Dehydratase n=1 Tax=Kibdelosporangium philippinense TaxID=211113 RepID=A0ABS8Z2H9_9PSEU|nr:hypothetical protein [Kibdelosporangium philippinense]MCE7002136.1 hypothetical protein [Kibdelosporangium philippinense]